MYKYNVKKCVEKQAKIVSDFFLQINDVFFRNIGGSESRREFRDIQENWNIICVDWEHDLLKSKKVTQMHQKFKIYNFLRNWVIFFGHFSIILCPKKWKNCVKNNEVFWVLTNLETNLCVLSKSCLTNLAGPNKVTFLSVV